MIIAMLAACGQEVSLETEITVPGSFLDELVYPHRVILAVDIPETVSEQLSLGEICLPQDADLVLSHSITLGGCALTGAITAWLEPASTDATCLLEPGSWEPLTTPPQGAPAAEAVLFEGSDACRSGTAESRLTLGTE
ncbi:MAG: hypothetical protein P8R54_12715 [Myxococcota bacterium]|nr:hypothetical protein [Myxococcota bacterium]